MGFMDTLMSKDRPPMDSTPKDGTNVRVSLRFAPLRLSAMQAGRVDLVVGLENVSPTNQLLSLDVALSKKDMLGFEPACISKTCENKVGQLAPGEKKEVRVGIWSNNQTKQGEYPVNVDIFAHYQDYNKVIHSSQKSITLRVV